MNKLIFQVGLLAFFISLAVFSLQSIPLFEAIVRSFIVFVAVEVVLGFGIVLVVWNNADKKTHTASSEPNDSRAQKIQPQSSQ